MPVSHLSPGTPEPWRFLGDGMWSGPSLDARAVADSVAGQDELLGLRLHLAVNHPRSQPERFRLRLPPRLGATVRGPIAYHPLPALPWHADRGFPLGRVMSGRLHWCLTGTPGRCRSGRSEGDGWSGRGSTRVTRGIGEDVALDAGRNGARRRRPKCRDGRISVTCIQVHRAVSGDLSPLHTGRRGSPRRVNALERQATTASDLLRLDACGR